MSEHPANPRQHRQISVRALVGSILLLLGIVTWLCLIYAIFNFSVNVGQFLEIVMSLAGSAS